ncbi:glycine/betaine ABC transporter substrate-binding protein [Rathayibacter sp. VKM Ac-2804]|uniref:glycine betaine ABC transporter substrate-binding protein n=1 Tax=Rathayibacter sp. VKM Ac-2804 TaxID=2609257 RepID=UPI00132EB50B|nr:glycine betaine ABC transporter substrate-binding protein [Rathayibacter sp. VKM Ac-2804]QHF25625.1 glycine/betaine ABC transporter substrate-binding protein [Rathayibacter sp. VKM Ac-2804]
MKKRTVVIVAAAVSALTVLSGCSGGGGGAASGGAGNELEGLTGQIGSKDFSEQYILAHITTDLLNAHGADLEANTKLVGSANVRQALENKDFVGYWEYTGTSWITYNGNTAPIPGAEAQFDAVKEADAAKGIAWLDPAPLNNTYAFAIRSSEAEELGVKTLSDVAELPADDQTFCIESEFSTRDDGWPGLKTAYGLDVPDSNVTLLDTGVIYTATQKGDDCNFGEVFQTDGRISALDLTVMEDDEQFFPVYQGGFTLQQSVLDEYPAIADVMAEVSPLLTTEEMQKLNAQVDVDGEDPEDVASEWLEDQGLLG